MKFKNWEDEFEEKFYSPKTLWAKSKDEKKWSHKKDVKDFIEKQIENARREERENIFKILNKWRDTMEVQFCGILNKACFSGYGEIIKSIKSWINIENG